MSQPKFNPTAIEELPAAVFVNTYTSLQMLQKMALANPETTFYMPFAFAFLYRQLLRADFAVGVSVVELQDNQEVSGVRALRLAFLHTGRTIEDESGFVLPEAIDKVIAAEVSRVHDVAAMLEQLGERTVIFNPEARDLVLDVAQLFPKFLPLTEKARFLAGEDAKQQLAYVDCMVTVISRADAVALEGCSASLSPELLQKALGLQRRRDEYMRGLYENYPRRPDWMRDVPWGSGDYEILEAE